MQTTQSTAVHPRSPIGALFLSILVPGAGSMYGGKPVQGALFLATYVVLWTLLLTGLYSVLAVPFAILVVLVWSPIHSFQSARAWNASRGVES